MAANYPYVNAPGPLHQFVGKLRTHFPSQVTAETLKKQGLAAKNESYVINTLRFINVLDNDGNKVSENTKFFVSDDSVFSPGLENLIKKAYSDLFDTNGDAVWEMTKSELTTFFRMSDDTSEIVGQRQASTFLALAAQAGHGEVPTISDSGSAAKPVARKKKAAKKTAKPAGKSQGDDSQQMAAGNGLSAEHGFGQMAFSLRIEMNLPTTDDQAVYDALFKSIRENLIEPYQSESS